jgi:NhaP-type Na+/H+ and K+/H+ antiporter
MLDFLNFFPNWIWLSLILTGLTIVIISRSFRIYSIPASVISTLVVAASSWMLGQSSNDKEWQKRIDELNIKIAAAQKESESANSTLETVVIEKTKIIKEQGKTQIEYIDRVITQDKEIVKYIEVCPIPALIIEEHNKAARLFEIEK